MSKHICTYYLAVKENVFEEYHPPAEIHVEATKYLCTHFNRAKHNGALHWELICMRGTTLSSPRLNFAGV